MPKVTGQRQAVAGILATGANGTRNVGKALFRAAEYLAVEAQNSITAGSQSGKGHVASLPGEPPNNDTSVLANNIEAVQVSNEKSVVSSDAPYAAALEFGTSKMAARPYMKPALERTKPILREYVARAVAAGKKGQDGTR
jgi:HK97 gp10 family phage protein